MAATVTLQTSAGKQPAAPTFVERVRLQGDTSYPAATGGYPLGLATVLGPGAKEVLGVMPAVQVGNDWGIQYDRANDKVKVFLVSTGAEVANGTNLAALDVELLVFSK